MRITQEIIHLYRALRYALQGIRYALAHERAFRLEAAMALVLVPAAFWVGGTPVERVLLAGSVLLVLAVELLNSAVEATVNRISAERHALSGLAKDLAGAAVLVSLCNAGLVWLALGIVG